MRGETTDEGEETMDELTKSIWIDAAPEVVFAYFTDAAKMARWCGISAELDPVVGGIYRLDMGEGGVLEGRFTAVEPPGLVAYEVDAPAGVEMDPSQVEITLTTEAGGTRVQVRHSGLAAPFQWVANRGWDHHLARLSVVVGGGSPASDSLCLRPMDSLLDPQAAAGVDR